MQIFAYHQEILKNNAFGFRWSYNVDPQVNVLKRLESNEVFKMIFKNFIVKSWHQLVTYIRKVLHLGTNLKKNDPVI